MQQQDILNEIIKQAKKLKMFTYEELESSLKHIPECTEKDLCIEWFLNSTFVRKHFQFFYYV